MGQIVKFFGIFPLIDPQYVEPGTYSPLFSMPAQLDLRSHRSWKAEGTVAGGLASRFGVLLRLQA